MLRALLAVVLALTLMVLDHRFAQLQPVREGLVLAVWPLHWLAGLPVAFSGWLRNTTTTRSELLEQNRELRADNLTLHARLQKFDTLQAENIRLRGLLDASYKIGERILIAELSAVDLNPYKHQVMIDKGSSSGVFTGQAVVDANAVIGQVVHTTPFSATVLLITDPSHAIPVRVARNGLRTIAVGTGRIDALSLPHLTTNSDIREGDQLISSGLGGKFPAGYPVARVQRIHYPPGNVFAEVDATPSTYLDRSREVLLVWEIAPPQAPAAIDRTAPVQAGSIPSSGNLP